MFDTIGCNSGSTEVPATLCSFVPHSRSAIRRTSGTRGSTTYVPKLALTDFSLDLDRKAGVGSMDWPSLVVGSVIGGLITWGVTALYSRRQEKVIAHLPGRIVQELIQRGLIVPEKETEARTAARRALVSWAAFEVPDSQAEMNQASYRDFERADLELRHVYERLRAMLAPEDVERLDEAQEAWRSFRDKQIRLAGGFYEGGSVEPLVHNMEALALTEAR